MHCASDVDSQVVIHANTNVGIYMSYVNYVTKGALHELNQMVNPRVNHLVKCRRVARDPNPRLKLT